MRSLIFAFAAAVMMGPAVASTVVTQPGYSYASGGQFNIDGYEYTLVAASGGYDGSRDVHTATASIEPGIARASTRYTCFFFIHPFRCGQGMGRAEADLKYRIEANVTDAFYLESGLEHVDVPMIYNWSVSVEVNGCCGYADAAVWFGPRGFNVANVRSSGARIERSGTYHFENDTIVRLRAFAVGNGNAVADPFGGVDPNWEYAHLSHLIEINTSPVPKFGISASLAPAPTPSPVPLPAGAWLLASAVGALALRRPLLGYVS